MNLTQSSNLAIFARMDQAYAGMTKVQQKLANFLRDSYTEVAFLSVHQLASRAGVSSASVVRFCQDLGYSGYVPVQAEMKNLVQENMAPMQEIRLSIAESTDGGDALREAIKDNITCLENSYTPALREGFKRSIDMLASARTVYVLGLRTTYSVSYYLYFMLCQVRDNVVIIEPGTGDMYDHLSMSGAGDVLIAISFSRYTRQTLEITNFMRNRKLAVIAITDRHTAPIARQAEAVLVARNSPRTFSFVTAFTIANALVVELGRHNPETTMKRLQERENIANITGTYI